MNIKTPPTENPKKEIGRSAFVNARLLDPATGLDAIGGILTDGEIISDFGPQMFTDSVPEDAKVIDCKGKCLAPGLVDMRITMSGSDFATTGMAAVAGGITTAVCLPNTNPVIDDGSVVEFVARAARKAGLVKVYPYGAITKGLEGIEISEMGLLAEFGAVAFSDANTAIRDAQTMRQVLLYASTFGLMVMEHPEDPSLAKGGAMNEGETATRLGLPSIPKLAEVLIVERDLRLARDTGGRLHFSHISTKESIDAIRQAKIDGMSVTCDTAPPYFSLNEGAIGDYRTFAKLSPPLRSEADRVAVIEGIKDGTIDAIASDHTPRHEDEKRLPFAQAATGGVGMETLLAITLELVHNGHINLIDALSMLSSGPADLLGLNAGRLKKGAPADLVLFDVDKGWKVDADHLHSKAKNTPFDERPVQGRVLRTVIDGRTVFELDS
ncbi:MAG: dihydroorotase [Rhodospirillaceae bacterium]|nr:dihydroorotase [Rhodospirillaceae bacterium]